MEHQQRYPSLNGQDHLEGSENTSQMSPSPEELKEYAEFLGMDLNQDQEFLYIAKQGLLEPVPEPWILQKDQNDDIIYINLETNEQSKEHPMDQYFKQIFLQEKQKKNQMFMPIMPQPKFITPQVQPGSRLIHNAVIPQHQYTPVVQTLGTNDSNMDFEGKDLLYMNKDFVTFNPPSGSFLLYQQPFANQQRDLSINTSFQTDINQFINAVNLQYSQDLEKHNDQKQKELDKFKSQAQENKFLIIRELQNKLQEHIESVKRIYQEQSYKKLKELKDTLTFKKETDVLKDSEYYKKNFNIDRDRIERRYEEKLREERDQMNTLHSLKIKQIKMEAEAKLSLEKSKLQFKFQEMATLSESEKQQVHEIEQLRMRLEEQLENMNDDLMLEFNAKRMQMKQEHINEKQKLQLKLEKQFESKIHEDRFFIEQQMEDLKNRKEMYMDELMSKQLNRVNLEKEQLDIKQKETIRDTIARSSKQCETLKESLRLKLELDFIQNDNQTKMAYHKQMNESDKEEKYKLIKQKEYVEKKQCIDREYSLLFDQIQNKYSTEEFELNQHQIIVKQIEILKHNIKELRNKKALLDDDYEHGQLIRQKIVIKCEQYKQSTSDLISDLKNKKDKELEQELKHKEEELDQINSDIKRLQAFTVLANKGNDEKYLQDMFLIKQVLQQTIQDQKQQKFQDEEIQDLEDLLIIIPNEITKTQNQIASLDKERSKLEELIKLIDQDLLQNVNQKEYGTKTFGIMTEFKVNMDNEKSKLSHNMNKILKQTNMLKDSLKMLMGMKRKVEATKKLNSPDKKDQQKDEQNRIRNEFKHYLRKQWQMKEEGKSKCQDIEIFIGQNRSDNVFQNYSSQEFQRKRIYGASRYSSKYSQILNKHNDYITSNLRQLTMI